ncbi:MAG: hypothetical protein GY830_09470 [Bacteroidetes bacterium]|nr:hypothetical protein [Bacteroidota bacterium]
MVGFLSKVIKQNFNTKKFKKNLYVSFPYEPLHYILLIIYIIFQTFTLFLSLPYDINISIPFLNYFFYFNLSSSLIIVYLYFGKIKSKRKKILWAIFLLYTYLNSIFMILISEFNHIHILIFFLNSLFLFNYFNYKIFFVLFFISVASILFFNYDFIIVYFRNIDFYLYAGFLGCASLAIFIRNRTLAKSIYKENQINLEKNNKHFSNELLKALDHQKKFIDTIDTECIDAFATLYQISKDLSCKLNSAKKVKEIKEISNQIIEVLDQNQHISNYLLQIIYKYKDHIKLNVNTINIRDFVFDIEKSYNSCLPTLKNKSKVFIQNEYTYEYIECDIKKICFLINESIKYIDLNNSKKNKLIMIKIGNAQLDYKISFMKGYIRSVDSLKIVISNDSLFMDTKNSYESNLKKKSIVLPQNIRDLSNKFNENILNAHYGYMNTISNKDSITQIYVIPKMLRRVRPKVMDIE